VYISFFRWVAILLGVFLCTPSGFGQEKEEPKKTPFQETAEWLMSGSAIQLMEYWHLPHLTSWNRLIGDDGFGAFLNVGDTLAGFQKRSQSFPDELVKALNNPDGVDHETAVEFLAAYACMARHHAAHFSEKSHSRAVDLALAPHTGKIREALVISLQAKAPKTRLMAALTLLSLEESRARANEVLEASAKFANAELLAEACGFIGSAHLTSPQAIAFLGRMLKHTDPTVREAAAGAAITMGRSARDLAPALIAFLETGKNAHGNYQYPLSISLPIPGNLALMSLESLAAYAKPAVPVILAQFTTASEEEQLAILACLANVGPKDKACLDLVRKTVKLEKAKLKLAAACTILHLAPGDREATELLQKALAEDTTKKTAIESCKRLGPPSREVVGSLLTLLDDKEEAVRVGALLALARIGPPAADAVLGIERLMAKEDGHITYTFHSFQAAANALARIRGKEAAAALLRVADSKTDGARYAMMYLPELGDDLPPTTLTVLLRAIKSDDRTKDMAAMALSNLGERARPVRRDLERMINDPAVGWILDTALRRIPANPR
jgi:HEAT repeat protein